MILLHLGGTVDVTAHQIMPDGILKEIHQATGGDWGGTKVDQAFENFLCEITGKNDIRKTLVKKIYSLKLKCFFKNQRGIKIKLFVTRINLV
jgi:hypothetical protein